MIPNSVTTIKNMAFCDCANLNNIIIPKSVIKLEGRPFCRCTNLTSVIFEDTENWYYHGLKKDVSDPASNATFLLERGDLTKNSN